jgi:hypothetical protein
MNIDPLETIISGQFNPPVALGAEIDCAFQSDEGYLILVMAGKLMDEIDVEAHFGFEILMDEDGLGLTVIQAPSGASITAFGRSASGHVLAFSATGNPEGVNSEDLNDILEALVREAARQVNNILTP